MFLVTLVLLQNYQINLFVKDPLHLFPQGSMDIQLPTCLGHIMGNQFKLRQVVLILYLMVLMQLSKFLTPSLIMKENGPAVHSTQECFRNHLSS